MNAIIDDALRTWCGWTARLAALEAEAARRGVEPEDTCLMRTESSAENCPPGHDCAECDHHTQEEA